MLTRQGRMHRDIAEFPNYAFYGNRLEVVPLHHQTLPIETCHSQNGIEQMLRTRRIAFVAAQKPKAAASVKTNQVEAEMIAATVVQIYNICKDRFDESQTVGVIVPYRNQIATIRGAIDRYGIGVLHNITIDTVERYQGSQRDYIIYGFTVQQPYQLNFLTNNVFEEDGMVIDRKLNVAMTRARLHLVLVGNPDILRENYTFYNLLEFVKSKDGYVDVPTEQFCKGDFRMPTAAQQNSEDDAFLGNNRDANLVFICYGKSDFSHGMSVYSREEERNIGLTAANQVEIFCRYLMPQYLNEAKQTFLARKEELMKLAAEYSGRLRTVDVGCGPATCGVALAEIMADDDINIEYVGIDVSEEMRAEGERQMKRFGGRNISWRFASSMEEAAESLSDAAQSPTLTIFCFSHFFASIDGETAERLAEQIIKIMAARKEDNHMFVIMQPQEDNRLMAFRAFRKVMNEV